MALIFVNPINPTVEDELVRDLKNAVDDNNVNRVRELLDLLKKRDKDSGLCTLDWEVGYYLLRDSFQKDRKIAELLLDYGVKTNRKSNQACNTPLHLAIKNHDLQMVQKLLSKGAKTRAKTSHGRTPLCMAVEEKDEKIVEILLEKDIEPAINIKNRLQPIEVAAKIGCEKIFNLLVKSGAESNLKYCDGTSMLHIAVEKGYAMTVHKIIDQKKYDITDCKSNQLLTAAVMGWGEEYESIVSTLVDAKFKVDPEKINDAEFIHKVAENGHYMIIQDLLMLGMNPNILNSNGVPLLITACRSKHANIVKTLINNKADVNVKDTMAHTVLYYIINNLHSISDRLCSHTYISGYSDDNDDVNENCLGDECTCCSNEWFRITKLLIDLGIDVNNKDQEKLTPLYYVAKYNYANKFYHYIKELTALLIKAGADVNARDEDGNTPLQYAITRGSLEIVELLLPSTNSDDNCHVNYKKQTLIHSAAQCQVPKIVKILLERKEFENVDIQDINGQTPLFLAVQCFCLPVIEILLQHGANVNLADNEMMTPLLCTLKYFGRLPRSEILLKYGANTNCVNGRGQTPLLIAALRNDDQDMKLLLKYGANINMKIDKSGKTALHYCAWREDKSISKLLEYGANVNIVDEDNNTALDCLNKSMVSFCEKEKLSVDQRQEARLIMINTRIFRKNAHIYTKHVLKLQTINSFVRQENLSAIYEYEDKYGWINEMKSFIEERKPKIDELQKMCQNEVELMKQHIFSNTNVNLYQILTKCPHRVAKYVLKNDNVIKQLQTPDFLEKFPIYCDLLNLRIEKCLERKKILDEDIDYSFHYVFPYLPFSCIDEILSYLSNSDLRVLISVCQSTMDCQNSEFNADAPTEIVASHVAKKQKI